MTVKNIIINLILKSKQFTDGMRNAHVQTSKAMSKVRLLGMQMGRLGSAVKKSTSQFQGWAMSLMFMGMAIARYSMGVIKSSVGMFTKVAESNGWAATNVQLLAGYFQFLMYTVGQAIDRALGPYMSRIIDVILAMNRWMRAHPKLVAGLLILTAAIGLTTMFGGMLVLGIWGGVIPAFILFGGHAISAGKSIVWLGKTLLALNAYIWGTLAPTLVKFIAGAAKGFLWLATNPVVWLVVIILAIALALKNASDHFGSFRNMAKVVLMQVGMWNAWLGKTIWNTVIWAINKLIAALKRLLTIAGNLPLVGKHFRAMAKAIPTSPFEKVDWTQDLVDWYAKSDFFGEAYKTALEKGPMKLGELFSLKGLTGASEEEMPELFAPEKPVTELAVPAPPQVNIGEINIEGVDLSNMEGMVAQLQEGLGDKLAEAMLNGG